MLDHLRSVIAAHLPVVFFNQRECVYTYRCPTCGFITDTDKTGTQEAAMEVVAEHIAQKIEEAL